MCGGGGMLNLDVSGPGAKPKYARLIRYIQSPPHISLTYSLPPFLSVAWSICLVSPISSEGTIQKETDVQRERERDRLRQIGIWIRSQKDGLTGLRVILPLWVWVCEEWLVLSEFGFITCGNTIAEKHLVSFKAKRVWTCTFWQHALV